ncbi:MULTISPECIES: helix-turn-helix domain-containing protein [Flavobacterium]|uniref:Helix-turn-helix transcriptional regulator n=1 Tax=Flavobacterium keumense TaxID=1306518 RepID=A0ABY8N5C4_9FLAO|nr:MULTISPECIES: helix-turn-helix transcriptional regulator [Flavobacterium]WGK94551.1 helix-turn-helix transcriptional regulator [Flavobacterium keumense]
MINSICEVIRIERLRRRLKQEDVAIKLGKSQSYYAKMENGEADFSLRKLVTLFDVFEIDPVDFFKEVKKLEKQKGKSS